MPVDGEIQDSDTLERVKSEEMFILELPQPADPDDIRDWALTNLFKFVEDETKQQFHNKTMIKYIPCESDKEETPTPES